MVHALLDARPDQCQMEIGEMMDIHQNTLGLLVVRLGACADAAVRAVRCVARFLCHRRRQSLQTLLVRTGVVDWLIMLLFDAKVGFLSALPVQRSSSLFDELKWRFPGPTEK